MCHVRTSLVLRQEVSCARVLSFTTIFRILSLNVGIVYYAHNDLEQMKFYSKKLSRASRAYLSHAPVSLRSFLQDLVEHIE